MSKYPNCNCGTTRFDYLRKRYKNGTMHLMRRCPACQAIAQNAMRQEDYDKRWVESLPVMRNGVTEHSVQSRADAIMEKLQKHISTRGAGVRGYNS